jgi:hypothetical protein
MSAPTIELSRVVAEVKAAILAYKSAEAADVPPLTSVTFDFKTVVDTTAGLSFSLLIFKFGGSVQSEDVCDTSFSWSLPALGLTAKPQPEPLASALSKAILAAANALKDAGAIESLNFSGLRVTISYGVTWDGNAAIEAPIELITARLSADHSKNSVHTVTLVFGSPPS